jgi:antitoxin MazE
MRAALRRLGNSRGVILPKPILAQLGIGQDDCLDLVVERDRIVLTKLAGSPRAGWATTAAEIAAAGDDSLVWPEFGNEDDAALTW